MVDDDPARARERVLTGLDAIYGRRESNEDIAIWGTPEQVADAVRRVVRCRCRFGGAQSRRPQRR